MAHLHDSISTEESHQTNHSSGYIRQWVAVVEEGRRNELLNSQAVIIVWFE